MRIHNRYPIPAAGFTLVELLTVIVIIIVLAGILTPTVQSAFRASRVAETKARIGALAAGITEFKSATGLYPGQDNPGVLGNPYTGSEWLARTMFTAKGQDPAAANWEPQDAYVAFDPKWLLGTKASNAAHAYALSDGFPNPRAICYYVSRPGESNINQYKRDDNSALTNESGDGGAAAFATAIRDSRLGGVTRVRNDGQFILIAAGADRKFFTADDIHNW